jgi:aspartokinase
MYRNWSIASTVRQVIELDSSYQDSLAEGYANLSALARIVKPTVENALGKKVDVETITTALKRMREKITSTPKPVASVLAKSMITMRTDISKLSLKRTSSTKTLTRIIMAKYKRRLLQVLEGVSVIVIIHERTIHDKLKQLFPRKYVVADKLDLAALFIKSPEEITTTPGCVTAILQQLSRRGINVEEVLSCHTDTTIVVAVEDGGRAFDALSQLINNCRRLAESSI